MRKKTKPFFTLIELLVTVAIIAILMCILLPSLRNAKEMGRRASCLNSQRQAGIIFHQYVGDYHDYWVYCTTPSYGSDTSVNRQWSGFLASLGYAKKGARIYAASGALDVANSKYEWNLYCPSQPTPIRTLPSGVYSRGWGDYILNALPSDKGFGNPTKMNQIPMPSQLKILVDRENKGNSFLYQYFNDFSRFAKFGQDPSITPPNVSCSAYLHGNGANYLSADGHAEWMFWENFRYRMFLLHPETQAESYLNAGLY